MKVEDWVNAVKLCPLMQYNEHYWSLVDHKPHDRVAKCYVVGKRRGGMLATVDEGVLSDLASHAVWSMASESTPHRLVGLCLRKPGDLSPVLKKELRVKDKVEEPKPKFVRGDIVKTWDPDYTEIWQVGNFDEYLGDRRYHVMDPITHQKRWFNEKGMQLVARKELRVKDNILVNREQKLDFQLAVANLPSSWRGLDLLTHTTISDLVFQMQHEMDLYDEREESDIDSWLDYQEYRDFVADWKRGGKKYHVESVIDQLVEDCHV